jgi:hypothetical protein
LKAMINHPFHKNILSEFGFQYTTM